MRLCIKHIRFLLTIIVIFISTIKAQHLSLTNFSNEDILPQNTVYTILQDQKGFMWFGTEDGICRFDGTNSIIFGAKDGLKSSFIYQLYQDKKGRIWAGTKDGLHYFNGKSFTFYPIKNAKNGFLYFTEDIKGNLYVFNETAGIVKIDINDLNHSIFLDLKKIEDSEVYSILMDHQNNLWIGTISSGLLKYTNNTFTAITEKDGLPSNGITGIFQDSQDVLWLATLKGVVRLYDDKPEIFEELNNALPERNMIFKMVQDSDRNFWIPTYGGGILHYDGSEFTRYSVRNGLPSNICWDAVQDNRGDIWIGFDNGGVSKLSAERIEIYGTSEGLPGNSIHSITQDNLGNYWFGHKEDGLSVFNKHLKKLEKNLNKLPSKQVSVLYSDSKSNVWVGYLGEEMSKINSSGIINYSSKDGLNVKQIITFLEDSRGHMWIGSETGLTKFDGKQFIDFNDKDGIPRDWQVYALTEDSDGNIWAGVLGHGLLRITGRKVTRFTAKEGLPNDNVLCILQDKTGYIWVATYGGGIARFDGSEFTVYDERHGLSSNTCYSMIEDGEYIYIGTSKGITRFEYKNFKTKGESAFRIFNSRDGLISSEMNQGAYLKDNAGNIWFGSQKGVIKINPYLIPFHNPPDVYIRKLRVISLTEEIDTTAAATNLELPYKFNSIRIEFSGISFAAPERLVYKYVLEGLDEKWSETADRLVTYRSLPPGDYTFKVYCRNSDGIWSKQAAVFRFEIRPPFWLTWWFISLSVIIGFAAIYSFYVYKTAQVKRRNADLEKMVTKRTHELEREKNKSDELLHNILPSTMVSELKNTGSVKPREYKNITIMFTDFVGFTYTAAVLPAESLVKELNEIFRGFDYIVDKYGLEKMKTIGDSYMVAGGIPVEAEDHAVKIICAGLEMQQFMQKRNLTSSVKWDMRLGVHSGQVVAGVVGRRKFTYDVWGDTVNIASRMESSGEPNRLNISAYTYLLVRNYFDCEYRGKIDAKGKGKLDMYLVQNVKSEFTDYFIRKYDFNPNH